MFHVLHPKFPRQQLSASRDFLLGREKTSLLYFFIRDAIDPELKYNKNRKKSQEIADKIGEKSERKSLREANELYGWEIGKSSDANRKFRFSNRCHAREVQVNTDFFHTSRRILGFFITFSAQTMPTRVVEWDRDLLLWNRRQRRESLLPVWDFSSALFEEPIKIFLFFARRMENSLLGIFDGAKMKYLVYQVLGLFSPDFPTRDETF